MTREVNEYAMWLREVCAAARARTGQPPLAPASVARTVVAVRSLHRFAVARG